ncbi:1-hydroxycarotenoid 3,4-desaturase CrtD [Pseudooctadecabacter sp.]|uniref:1-hydroxycarotenoid 3,4-desaturase CrtD n=1 Tax=Pseudooctadecabacter sp. TaxID=1966338 RepID=UPI0025F87FE4|nr:1-hydroxycarotenoid 3,4-desaturase CrtD [Pseudooctadecabacter sp.]
MSPSKHIIVVGTGVGGLATALRLLSAGAQVTMFEAAEAVGGKMRTVPSVAGPVDAGPTVLTMRWVFDDLFAACGARLDDHVTVTPDSTIARHFWSDGTTLDLMADPAASTRNVADVFGPRAAQEFTAFSDRARRLFTAFDTPMMQAAKPSSLALAGVVLKDPRLLRAMAPHQTLAQMLRSQFSEPKLRQLFGRYATYVGGSPYASPALLSLIWHAEGTGVWSVKGGMHALARAMYDLIVARGGKVYLDAPVSKIIESDTGVCVTVNGTSHHADAVVFNGDPRALTTGHLGDTARTAVPETAVTPRSLSADVMAFAAIPHGVDLSHHNVFFGNDPRDEFDPIAAGKIPTDPTLYICAQDRGGNAIPTGPERFEIIMNAAPCGPNDTATHERAARCQTHILTRLGQMGLSFTPMPNATTLTQPADFNHLFPASLGSLYGRSPHGMTAGLKRPTARTAMRGLYLAGGGAHPGAGVPMATLSGLHAAEAICTDLRLTSPSRPTAMRGGTSTASATTAPAPSASSPS